MSRTNLSIPSLKVLSELITKGCATLWSNKSQSMASDSSPMTSSSSGPSEPSPRSSPSLPAPLSCSKVLQSSSSCGSEWLGPRCHHHDIHAASIWSVSRSSPDGGSSRWSLSPVTVEFKGSQNFKVHREHVQYKTGIGGTSVMMF